MNNMNKIVTLIVFHGLNPVFQNAYYFQEINSMSWETTILFKVLLEVKLFNYEHGKYDG